MTSRNVSYCYLNPHFPRSVIAGNVSPRETHPIALFRRVSQLYTLCTMLHCDFPRFFLSLACLPTLSWRTAFFPTLFFFFDFLLQLSSYFSALSFPVSCLQSNISKHILHTVLYTFPKVVTRRINLTVKSFFSR